MNNENDHIGKLKSTIGISCIGRIVCALSFYLIAKSIQISNSFPVLFVSIAPYFPFPSLMSHISVHTKEYPYHCNQCPGNFNQSQTLKAHSRMVHKKEGWENTNKAFVRKPIMPLAITIVT
ncbi:unnamed protein product [Orchesella dallaii]|uniref:C2H2-type domain-containing protein n=1 Tax=Orchesella dallaii TaxID=48710 RepID=A0ABP1QCF3_9HEXA